MIWFIIRRFLGLILTLWIVFTLSFLLMHAVPGGPYSSERNLPPEIEENFKEKYRAESADLRAVLRTGCEKLSPAIWDRASDCSTSASTT